MSETAYQSYYGKVYYDIHGKPVEEVGDTRVEQAKAKIVAADKALKGSWAYALIRKMKKMGVRSVEQWENVIQFPDGKFRDIAMGEVAPELQPGPTKGKWITIEMARRVYNDIRPAVGKRFPYGTGALICKLCHFDSMLSFQRHMEASRTPVFIFEPNDESAPNKDGLFVYMVVAPN